MTTRNLSLEAVEDILKRYAASMRAYHERYGADEMHRQDVAHLGDILMTLLMEIDPMLETWLEEQDAALCDDAYEFLHRNMEG